MKKLIPVVAGIIVAGVVVGALAGVGRLPVVSQETGGTSGELRWLNVTIQLPPQDSPLRVSRRFAAGPERARFVINVSVEGAKPPEPGREETWKELQIDAETGEVISDTLSATYLTDTQAILDSLRVTTEPPTVWPYADVAPPPESLRLANLTYIVPDLASGILIAEEEDLCFAEVPCTSEWLVVSSGRSEMGINGDTGEVDRWDGVLPEDREAFERYAASVQVDMGG